MHDEAADVATTDWPQVVALYDVLARVAPSPLVELNRAVAVAMRDGPAAGLALLDELAGDHRLRGYHLLPAARADLLRRLGRRAEAAAAYREALALVGNEPERAFLRRRLAELTTSSPPHATALPCVPACREHLLHYRRLGNKRAKEGYRWSDRGCPRGAIVGCPIAVDQAPARRSRTAAGRARTVSGGASTARPSPLSSGDAARHRGAPDRHLPQAWIADAGGSRQPNR